MSFNPYDNNEHMIHLGNYEEYFILYLDNELSDADMRMVDDFLAANPGLRAEFDALLGTKLPLEEFSINKEELFADSIRLNTVDESLLLFIDNELAPADRKKVEEHISRNKDLQLQHKILLASKLDPSEIIAYPNKEELYHRTERVVIFRPWMRVAAAVLLVTGMGAAYFFNGEKAPAGSYAHTTPARPATKETKLPSAGKTLVIDNPNAENELASGTSGAIRPDGQVAASGTQQASPASVGKKATRTIRDLDAPALNLTADNDLAVVSHPDEQKPLQSAPARSINADVMGTSDVAFSPSKIISDHPVTSTLITRNTDIATIEEEHDNSVVKGSVKGFLRKATRLIEKNTGINPTNDNGELLIGAVAVKLK